MYLKQILGLRGYFATRPFESTRLCIPFFVCETWSTRWEEIEKRFELHNNNNKNTKATLGYSFKMGKACE